MAKSPLVPPYGSSLSGADPSPGTDRKARLAAALRENLKRRKAQGRQRRPAPDAGPATEK